MKRLIPAVVLACISLNAHSASAPEKRAMTPNDLVMMERISDPRVSPAGDAVAYVLRETDYAANKGTKSIWLTSLDSKTPDRKFTGATGNSDTPRWSADGQWLYFLSTRGGSSQVWRMSTQGGEAEPVTALPMDVGAFKLSPDGARIAFSLEVFPDCGDLDCSKKRFDELATRKNSGTLHERLFVRHFDTWANGTRSQLFTAVIAGNGKIGQPVWVSKGIDGDVPSKPFGGDEEWAFSPDGKTLVFSARIAGNTESWSTNLDLFLVATDGSDKSKNLTADNAATDVGPLYSPDGSRIYYRAMSRATFEADRYRLMEKALATGATREIAPGWDRSPEAMILSADGKTIYCVADDLGQVPLFAVTVATGKVVKLTQSGAVSGFGLSKTGVVYSKNTINSPDQLFRADPDGGNAVALTAHNQQRLAEIAFGPYEQFSFPGWNNETVYGHVVKPWNYQPGKKYPVAFIVHGGPQYSMGNFWHYRWNPAVFSGMGYAVVFIDFHGSTGYGQAFTDSITGDWGGKPLADLKKGWQAALKKYDYLDGGNACALGASFGGYMMNWIEGNWPDGFKCIVAHGGLFDLRSMAYATDEMWFTEWEHGGPYYEKPESFEKDNPVNHVTAWKTPMLVTHGAQDFRVPLDQGIGSFTALQRRGIPSQLLIFPDENHWILKPQNSLQWHQTVQAWLKRWLGS